MPFSAKSSQPVPSDCTYRHPTFIDAARNHPTIFTCSPGYLDTECLLAELIEQQRRVIWLRLDPEDSDPATFILSLLHAIPINSSGLADELREKLRRSPGPVFGWAPLYHLLSQVLVDALGENGALIIEHAHKLVPIQPVLGLIGSQLLPGITNTITCILISHEHLPTANFSGEVTFIGNKELELQPQIGIRLAHESDLCLPDKVVQQAIQLTQGRIGALKSLLSACEMFGQDFLQDLIQHGKDVSHLMTIILSRWLATLDEEEIQALLLCSKLNYTHPDLLKPDFDKDCPAEGPWLQQLSGGWRRLRCLWEIPIDIALRDRTHLNLHLGGRLAQRLEALGAAEQSIQLSFALGNYQDAASYLTRHIDQWMEFGQWDMLERSLGKLPKKFLGDHPQLLFAQGEILAMSGRISLACRWLSRATTQFLSQGDLSGGCQSMLAESSLCIRQRDTDRAQLYALAALDLAHTGGLNQLQSLANWQLGRVAVALDQIPEALVYLDRATANSLDSTDNPVLTAFHHQLAGILKQKTESDREILGHYQAYVSAKESSENATHKLDQILNTPARELVTLFPDVEWTSLPLIFKLGSPDLMVEVTPKILTAGLRQRLLSFLGRYFSPLLQTDQPRPTIPEGGVSMLQISLALPGPDQPPTFIAPDPTDTNDAPQPKPTMPAEPALALNERVERPTLRLTATVDEPIRYQLAVYCLGAFRLFQVEKWIETWPSRKAMHIFKYLLIHRHTFVSKDILMDIFWRDSDPEAARRNLHQAIYALRQILKTNDTDVQHILFENDGYCLNPDLSLWVDHEEFQEHVRIGQQFLRAGLTDKALDEYAIAESLYQGDFLEEDVYEDWIQAQRQSLQLLYISVATYLTQHHLARSEYYAAITLCQRVLSRDSCQEEAHRNLMLCYMHLGQRNLAVRQYQLCLKSLKDELSLTPSEETRQLYRQLVPGPKQTSH